MKRIATICAGLMLALCTFTAVTGCGHKTAPPAWAITAPERTVGDIIASAVSTVVGYEQDQADCAAKPELTKCPGVSNPKFHAAIQGMQKALAIAQPEYKKWDKSLKNNPLAPEPANLAAAISTIQTTLAQLPTLTK